MKSAVKKNGWGTVGGGGAAACWAVGRGGPGASRSCRCMSGEEEAAGRAALRRGSELGVIFQELSGGQVVRRRENKHRKWGHSEKGSAIPQMTSDVIRSGVRCWHFIPRMSGKPGRVLCKGKMCSNFFLYFLKIILAALWKVNQKEQNGGWGRERDELDHGGVREGEMVAGAFVDAKMETRFRARGNSVFWCADRTHRKWGVMGVRCFLTWALGWVMVSLVETGRQWAERVYERRSRSVLEQ